MVETALMTPGPCNGGYWNGYRTGTDVAMEAADITL